MENLHKPYGPYERFFKRPLDFTLALIALIVLSPLLLILTIVGAIAMKGNPFFVQRRPGRIDKKTGQEKIFPLLKFRTMSNAKDENGKLLPDILCGHLAIVGPRPLLVQYIPRYSEEQRHRHDVRPGLTGYAQVHGRNGISWEEKFRLDVQYTQKVTFAGDVKIIFATVVKVLKHEGISSEKSETMEEFIGDPLTDESVAVEK